MTPSLKTTVVNITTGAPFDAYVGRPAPRRRLAGSVWRNPFVIGKDGNRATVIAKYRAALLANPALMARIGELRGKRLACWCSPLPCHADVLAELADGT